MKQSANRARNTDELMDVVLQRLNQIEERLAEHEAAIGQAEAMVSESAVWSHR